MRSIFLGAFFVMCSTFIYAQPGIQWQHSYGGTGVDIPYYIQQTPDGGFVIAGTTNSTDGDVTGNHGNGDCWVLKLNSSGGLVWQKTFGGSNQDVAKCVQQTTDGGYIVTGYTSSSDGDVTDSTTLNDIWVVKLSSGGSIQWQKSFDGGDDDRGYSVRQTTDGGYIVAGSMTRFSTNVDYCILKLDDTGALTWYDILGGTGADIPYDISSTSDGGYIIAGLSGSLDIEGHHGGTSADYWIVKMDSNGNSQWRKSYGGTGTDIARSIKQTADGGYIAGGYSTSTDGDVTGNHTSFDYWVVKLSDTGKVQWEKSLGSVGASTNLLGRDYGFTVDPTPDGGFLVGGITRGTDGDVTGNHGATDVWVVRLNDSGAIEWEKCYGGSGADGFVAGISPDGFWGCATADGGYAFAVRSTSNDSDVSGNHGAYDIWVAKLNSFVSVPPVTTDNIISVIPNPTTGAITLTGLSSANICIYNSLGRLVRCEKNTSNTSISDMPAGIYLVKVYDMQGVLLTQQKIEKE